jgi:glycosyltransferase involved in cell wall biosynthesis
VYNVAPFVADCLTSILGQKENHDYEVIVIDDASTDASAEVIATFDDPRIRLIRHRENLGPARTITEGRRRSIASLRTSISAAICSRMHAVVTRKLSFADLTSSPVGGASPTPRALNGAARLRGGQGVRKTGARLLTADFRNSVNR